MLRWARRQPPGLARTRHRPRNGAAKSAARDHRIDDRLVDERVNNLTVIRCGDDRPARSWDGMAKFRHYKLRTKLTIMVVVILLLATAANVILVNRMDVLNAEIGEIESHRLPAVTAAGNIGFYASDLRIAQLQHAFTADDAEKLRLALLMVELIEKIEKNRDIYETLIETNEERE